MTKPTTWITPAVDGNRDTATAFNLLVNLPDRRISFGEEGITDVYLTTGKTSLYTMMGMMSSSTVRQMFGAGSETVPLSFNSATSFSAPNLVDGAVYDVSLIATDLAGNASAPLSAKSIT